MRMGMGIFISLAWIGMAKHFLARNSPLPSLFLDRYWLPDIGGNKWFWFRNNDNHDDHNDNVTLIFILYNY